MKVAVSFELDVDPAAWAGADEDTMTTRQVAAEAAAHAEAVVRDLYYDQGWITHHHPEGDERRDNCRYCVKPDVKRRKALS